MKLGVFTPLFAKLSLDEVLAKVRDAGLDAVELGTGAFPGSDHVDVDGLLASQDKAREFRSVFAIVSSNADDLRGSNGFE